MRNLNAPRRSNAAAAALVLALLAVAGPSVAAEFPTGFFLGLDVGAGGTSIHYRDGDRTISEDPEFAGLGGLRLGYAVSPHFALALEDRVTTLREALRRELDVGDMQEYQRVAQQRASSAKAHASHALGSRSRSGTWCASSHHTPSWAT